MLEDGRPFLDMAHVITNLNRLDAGIPDTVSDRLIARAIYQWIDWFIYLFLYYLSSLMNDVLTF